MAYSASPLFPSDPFALMRRMSQDMDRMFRAGAATGGFPAVNVWQNNDAAVLTAELPGVEPDDVDVTVKEGTVTLSGERKAMEPAEGAVWHRRERGFGKFSRSLRLPFRVDPDRIEARFQDGVLTIALQRPDQDKPRRIEIKAG